VPLNCIADGKPTSNITWTSPGGSKISFEPSFSLAITSKMDEGTYNCTADNGVGTPVTATVNIIVQNYHPINTKLETNLTNNAVVVNKNFNVICQAQANPLAKYRFYKGQKSLFNTTVGKNSDHFTTAVSERINQVDFSCTPFNYFGDGATDTILVKVHCKYTNYSLIL